MNYNKSLFGGVPKKQINKSKFNLSHEWKARFQPAQLVPMLLLETLPEDYFEIDSEFLFRFLPMYYPIAHRVTMRADYFYIPNRILWFEDTEGGVPNPANPGWKKFITGQTDVTPPKINVNMRDLTGTFYNGHVMGYMGLPILSPDLVGASTTIAAVSAFPLSAYLKIWDEYYRVPQLEDEKWFNLLGGTGTNTNTNNFDSVMSIVLPYEVWLTLPAKWEKDYFTSAIPEPQIGDAVQIPMHGLDDDGNPVVTRLRRVDTQALVGSTTLGTDTIDGAPGGLVGQDVGSEPLYLETEATIKQLRIAEVLQSFYERIMKVGQRYRDFIEGLWGNDPEPLTVDVPLMLGSKFGLVTVSDVMTQANTTLNSLDQRTGDYTGQSNMYSSDGGKIKYLCREHGWIMGIIQVNANTGYGQGIHRMWRRNLFTDYALDMFAQIGDQEILKEEVVYNPVTADATKNQDTFGYIPRFSEYRYINNIFVGEMALGTSLSMHLGRLWRDTIFTTAGEYDALQISQDFIQSSASARPRDAGFRVTDIYRALPVNTEIPGTISIEMPIIAHIFHSIWVDRALPLYSTPDLT